MDDPEVALKLLISYIEKFEPKFDIEKPLSLNTHTMRYMNARLREYDRQPGIEEKSNIWKQMSEWWNGSVSITRNEMKLLKNAITEKVEVCAIRSPLSMRATELDLAYFLKLTRLDVFNSDVVYLKNIPENLEEIYLFDTEINFQHFKSLKSISMNNCAKLKWTTITPSLIKSLESISCIHSIQLLDLSYLLGSENEDHVVWENLSRLICEKNFLATIDLDVLKKVPNLESLLLCNNQISSITLSKEIQFHHLKELDLSQNNLVSIPLRPNSFKALKKLNLSNNKLKTTMGIEFIDSLETLDLSANLLINWTDIRRLQQLEHLIHLRLKDNEEIVSHENYRSYACGYFLGHDGFTLDDVVATANELNFHKKKFDSSSSSSDTEQSYVLEEEQYQPVPEIMSSPVKRKRKKNRRAIEIGAETKKSVEPQVDKAPQQNVNDAENFFSHLYSNREEKSVQKEFLQSKFTGLKKNAGDQWLVLLNEEQIENGEGNAGDGTRTTSSSENSHHPFRSSASFNTKAAGRYQKQISFRFPTFSNVVTVPFIGITDDNVKCVLKKNKDTFMVDKKEFLEKEVISFQALLGRSEISAPVIIPDDVDEESDEDFDDFLLKKIVFQNEKVGSAEDQDPSRQEDETSSETEVVVSNENDNTVEMDNPINARIEKIISTKDSIESDNEPVQDEGKLEKNLDIALQDSNLDVEHATVESTLPDETELSSQEKISIKTMNDPNAKDAKETNEQKSLEDVEETEQRIDNHSRDNLEEGHTTLSKPILPIHENNSQESLEEDYFANSIEPEEVTVNNVEIDSLSSKEMNTILFQGYCRKEGHVWRNWRRRYFKLTPTRWTYGKDEKDELSINCIECKNIKSVRVTPHRKAPKKFQNFGFSVEVHGNGTDRIFKLVAESQIQLRQWIAAFQKIKKQNRSKKKKSLLQRTNGNHFRLKSAFNLYLDVNEDGELVVKPLNSQSQSQLWIYGKGRIESAKFKRIIENNDGKPKLGERATKSTDYQRWKYTNAKKCISSYSDAQVLAVQNSSSGSALEMQPKQVDSTFQQWNIENV